MGGKLSSCRVSNDIQPPGANSRYHIRATKQQNVAACPLHIRPPGIEFHMAKRKGANVLSSRKTDNKNLVFRWLRYDPAPKWMGVLIELSRLHFIPLMDTDLVRALNKSVAFINHEDVLDNFAPREFARQSFMIAAKWPDWESRRMTWDERAADLERNGV